MKKKVLREIISKGDSFTVRTCLNQCDIKKLTTLLKLFQNRVIRMERKEGGKEGNAPQPLLFHSLALHKILEKIIKMIFSRNFLKLIKNGTLELVSLSLPQFLFNYLAT
jgi:hypothetical protein